MLILSKLQPPQVKTKTLRRRRLVELLRKNLDKKIILVQAGAGYGKTTLLSHLLTDLKQPYIFYHLEKEDADPAVFFNYLLEGLERICPGSGKKTRSLLHLFNYSTQYVTQIVTVFANELLALDNGDLFFILEDFHQLSPQDIINEIMTKLIRYMPPNVHFIITSRTRPPFASALLRGRDESFELDTQALKFTKDEIRAFFQEIYSLPVDPEDLEWLSEQSEGWPTNLRMLIQTFQHENVSSVRSCLSRLSPRFSAVQDHIFEFLSQEVFEKETPAVKRFLIDCSVLDWLSPDLCDHITKNKNSETILADLASRNSFISSIPGIGYRMHNLYRDFLRAKVDDPQRTKKILHDAGDMYLRSGRKDEAMRMYLQSDDHKKAAVILGEIASRLIEQGKNQALCSYIERIPGNYLLKDPQLMKEYAQSLVYLGKPGEAKKYLRRAIRILPARLNRRQAGDMMYRLAGIYLNDGDLKNGQRWLLKALSTCPREPSLVRASILGSLGSMHVAMGGRYLTRARVYFKNALRITHKKRFLGLEVSILNNSAICELKQGNLHRAYDQLVAMARLLKDRFSPGCGAGFYNAARVGLYLGKIDESHDLLESGLKLCSRYDDQWSMTTVWKGYALLHQELGDYKGAREFILKSLDLSEKTGVPWLIASSLHELCRINLAEGMLDEAENNIAMIWKIKKQRDDAETIPFLVSEARLRKMQEKYSIAQDILKTALSLAQVFKQPQDLFMVDIESASLMAVMHDNDKAAKYLDNAVRISRIKNYDYLFIRALAQDHGLLRLITTNSKAGKYAISAVKKYPANLVIFEAKLFGHPSLVINGREIDDREWRTVKAKKLLFYLILNSTGKVNQDILIEKLWYDTTLRKGKSNLRKAVQHVRVVFRSAGILDSALSIDKGFYRLAPHVCVWTDISQFENLVLEAKKDKYARPSIMQKLLTIYRDGFATGWYDDWIEEKRRYYQYLFEKITLRNS